MKQIVIFDFDGTIVDSMNTFADIAESVLNKYFDTPLEMARRQYFATSGLPFSEQIEILHPKNSKNKKAADEYETKKKISYLNHKIFDDAENAIKLLNKKNIKTVVSSNNFQNLVDLLVDKIGIKFDLVLGWQNKDFAKGRAHFEYVRKKFNCDIKDMIFVGDSLKDRDKAKDYGIDFIAKTGTFNRSDFEKYDRNIEIIDSLNDLTNLII